MPSLHFGYSLLVGLTIITLPLAPQHRRSRSIQLPFFNQSHPQLGPKIKVPSRRRLLCLALGFAYPFSILIAIISTANHFILDAVAGGIVCAIGWQGNGMLLNLLPLEDWFLWCLRLHKPDVSCDGQLRRETMFDEDKRGDGYDAFNWVLNWLTPELLWMTDFFPNNSRWLSTTDMQISWKRAIIEIIDTYTEMCGTGYPILGRSECAISITLLTPSTWLARDLWQSRNSDWKRRQFLAN